MYPKICKIRRRHNINAFTLILLNGLLTLLRDILVQLARIAWLHGRPATGRRTEMKPAEMLPDL